MEQRFEQFDGTTILAVRKNDQVCICGDGPGVDGQHDGQGQRAQGPPAIQR